ncbi:retrovirus-related pol polyprotein from transposon TNT 1-94 [Tanacetum coccineum]
MKDKVAPNNSQVKFKKTEVEEHHRISSISYKTKSVTACNDSLKSKTLNVNDVCATCGKCMFNSNHDACVSKFLNDVNARTKKPKVVPINLEVAFQKSTCFVRDLQRNDLLTGNCGSDFYTISLQETSSSTPICFMDKALPTQAWLWHRILSHHNFDYINLLSKKDIVIGLPKLKYVKDQLCSSCELSKAKKKFIQDKASKLPLFFWAEEIATTCYTQNRYIIISTHEKTAYHIINDRKPSIRHLHIFGCTCYLTRDGENLDKMKEKGDPCILVGYSTQSKGYRVYNKRTRLIVESIHLRFDEIKEMSKTPVDNNTSGLIPQRQKALDYDNSGPATQLQNVSPLADTTDPSQQEFDLLFSPMYDDFFTAEAMQEELHQFDRLQVWELPDKPFGKTVID